MNQQNKENNYLYTIGWLLVLPTIIYDWFAKAKNESKAVSENVSRHRKEVWQLLREKQTTNEPFIYAQPGWVVKQNKEGEQYYEYDPSKPQPLFGGVMPWKDYE